jgi:hypothetical protein
MSKVHSAKQLIYFTDKQTQKNLIQQFETKRHYSQVCGQFIHL